VGEDWFAKAAQVFSTGWKSDYVSPFFQEKFQSVIT
jgi:hypothetical protein